MRLLLDTNALLWALTNSPRLEPVRDLLLAEENDIFRQYCVVVGNRYKDTDR